MRVCVRMHGTSEVGEAQPILEKKKKPTNHTCSSSLHWEITRLPTTLASNPAPAGTFLRGLAHELEILASTISSIRDTSATARLQHVYAEFLWYRVKFGESKEVSASNRVQEQYRMWTQRINLTAKEASISGTVKDMHDLLNTVQLEKQQERIDALAVVLGFIGLMQLCNDIVAAYVSMRERACARLCRCWACMCGGGNTCRPWSSWACMVGPCYHAANQHV